MWHDVIFYYALIKHDLWLKPPQVHNTNTHFKHYLFNTFFV